MDAETINSIPGSVLGVAQAWGAAFVLVCGIIGGVVVAAKHNVPAGFVTLIICAAFACLIFFIDDLVRSGPAIWEALTGGDSVDVTPGVPPVAPVPPAGQ